jgi:hypothetical protein
VEEFALYGGSVILKYDDAKHKYVAVEADGTVVNPPSITTALGVLNKPAIVQWAVNCAINHLRSRLYDGGEFDVEDLERFLDEAKYAHKWIKEEAADIGSAAHQWLEDYWHQKMKAAESGEEFAVPPLPEHPQVKNCVEAAVKWIEEHHITPIVIEKPLYSRRHKVAGRMDKLATVDGKLVVVDWKSSAGLWEEYRFQIAAYLFIYEEETGRVPVGAWLVRLGKYDGEFEAKYFTREQLMPDMDAFVAASVLYKRKQVLSRKG